MQDDDAMDSDLEELLLASVYYSSKYELNSSCDGSLSVSDLDDGEKDDRGALLKGIEGLSDSDVQTDSESEEVSKYSSFAKKEVTDLCLDASQSSDAEVEPEAQSTKRPSLPEHRIIVDLFTNNEDEPINGVLSSLVPQSESEEGAENRYFGTENQGPVCFVCGEPGHVFKTCQQYLSRTCCYLCGSSSHNKPGCDQEFCFNCERPGHQSKGCNQPRKKRMLETAFCSLCKQPGHYSSGCSLVWRRYRYDKRLSTSLFNDSISKAKKYCYWCSAKGHYGDDCPKRPKFGQARSIFHQATMEFLQLTVGKQPSSSNSSKPRTEGSKSRPEVKHIVESKEKSAVKPKLSSNSRESKPPPPTNALKQAALKTASSCPFRTKPNLPSRVAPCKSTSSS